jgi:hypothetical protein
LEERNLCTLPWYCPPGQVCVLVAVLIKGKIPL